MKNDREEGLLLTLALKDEIFKTLKEMNLTEKQFKVFQEVEPNLSQSEIARRCRLTQSGVSRAIEKLKNIGLVESSKEGYEKTISTLSHPVIKHLWKEVFKNE